jgi:hypothetical protein
VCTLKWSAGKRENDLARFWMVLCG